MGKDINFSRRTEEVTSHSFNEAVRLGAVEVAPEHLFLGIVKTHDQTRKVLMDLRIDVDELIGQVSKNHLARAGK